MIKRVIQSTLGEQIASRFDGGKMAKFGITKFVELAKVTGALLQLDFASCFSLLKGIFATHFLSKRPCHHNFRINGSHAPASQVVLLSVQLDNNRDKFHFIFLVI